jgi:DNA-directed RNA polymerase specialized sigma subunit
MCTAPPTTNGHIRELTQEEGRALLDREACRVLGMSAEEFIQAWEAGKFDDDPDHPDVMYVAMLLPFAQ